MHKKTDLDNLADRVERLERAVFGSKVRGALKSSGGTFSGLKGGITLLISKGFFSRKRTATETKEQLATHGYHYVRQAIQTTLNRLATVRGPLVTVREENIKYYVIRK